jgi:two-component system phosphate regulon response regulator OmpR
MAVDVLMIDDDERLSAMVIEYLASMDMNVRAEPSVRQGLEALAEQSYSALILDVMLPDGDGFDVCRTVRAGSDIPVLMLTARGDEMDRIVGLEIGADDYLPKPFNPRELLARLRALIRRANVGARDREQAGGSSDVSQFGRLTIDRGQRRVLIDDEERALTGHQFDLLCALAEHPGRVMSRDALMHHLKGHDMDVFDRSIDVHISRIRAAIEDDPKKPRRVITLRGAGYLFTRDGG